MAEGWVTKIVRKAQSLGQIFVEAESARDRPPDLRNFDTVSQANSKVIAVWSDEHLGLVPKPPEPHGMYDAVAIPLINIARAPRATIFFREGPAAGLCWQCGKVSEGGHSLLIFLMN
jgi:hypothetical protein